MHRVQITVSIASFDWSFSPQEVVIVSDRFRSKNDTHSGEIPADIAATWLSVGHAVEIPEPKGPAPVESAAVAPPETAVAPAARGKKK